MALSQGIEQHQFNRKVRHFVQSDRNYNELDQIIAPIVYRLFDDMLSHFWKNALAKGVAWGCYLFGVQGDQMGAARKLSHLKVDNLIIHAGADKDRFIPDPYSLGAAVKKEGLKNKIYFQDPQITHGKLPESLRGVLNKRIGTFLGLPSHSVGVDDPSSLIRGKERESPPTNRGFKHGS